jgi:Holliday junction resolvase RusA-like endonuclease
MWKGNGRRDCDNVWVKKISDTLVSEGILTDDDTKHVCSVILGGETGCKEEGVRVTIMEKQYAPKTI